MMFLTTSIICLALAVVSSHSLGQEEHETDNLLITLYYECYCPDCIEYVANQVGPAWKHFHANLTLDLVPFGNARQWYVDGHYKFECQHGPKECVGNKLHACAIQQACGAAGTKRCSGEAVTRALGYIHCLEQAPDQEQANDKCATSVQLKPAQIAKCAGNRQGDRLLSLYGNRTSDFRPKIQYVPTVAFDGKHNRKAENDLIAEICVARPSLCSGLDNPNSNHVMLH